tara:strand:- start:290 stop:481 length:192 start_codon:yes stop_codon:yes gene_type:complete
MNEQYSIEEILNAVNDLSNLKKKKLISTILPNENIAKKSDIPLTTLKLIEEAEKNIKIKNSAK